MKTVKHCCLDMDEYIKSEQCVRYSEIVDEYSIPCLADDTTGYLLKFCPWCGRKLPASKRDLWFDKLEQLGFDEPLFNDSIPEEFKTSQWWQQGLEDGSVVPADEKPQS